MTPQGNCCAMGEPLDGVKPCRRCGAGPREVCGPHYRVMCEEVERLRALLTDAPVLIINERYAAVIGEDVCLAYMQAIREWHPKVQAALTGESVGEK